MCLLGKVNMLPGRCRVCKYQVKAHSGIMFPTETVWAVYHHECYQDLLEAQRLEQEHLDALKYNLIDRSQWESMNPHVLGPSDDQYEVVMVDGYRFTVHNGEIEVYNPEQLNGNEYDDVVLSVFDKKSLQKRG